MSPMVYSNPNGEFTVSIGLGANAFFIGGVSFNVFVSIDDSGNFALRQMS